MRNSPHVKFLLSFLLLSLFIPSFAWPDQAKIADDAGFMILLQNEYYFHRGSYFDRLSLTSSKALIWYSFQSADQNPGNKPLFLFFNGGPYAATSSGLWSMNTSRYTMNNKGDAFISNPNSWTRIGNLLYIDARTTGFSYNKMINPEDYYLRYKEFNAQNFNMFVDAADFIRVLLKFLSSKPELQKNRVFIVGESYGGIRATVMLHILLNYQDYGDGTEIYQNANLVKLIQDHYDVVFPEYAGQKVPPEVIAEQFSHQILIQPAISWIYQDEVAGEMWEKEGSILYKIAQEEGVTYQTCPPQDSSCNSYSNGLEFAADVAGRDVYRYNYPDGWTLGYFDKASELLRYSDNLQKMTGVNIRNIRGMYANTRLEEAYKVRETNHPNQILWDPMITPFLSKKGSLYPEYGQQPMKANIGDLEDIFGHLPAWDRYFLSFNYDAINAQWWNVALQLGYDIQYRTHRCGKMFLKNVVHVNTMITNAQYDLVVYSPAIPKSLGRHVEILESSVHDTQGETPANRIGRIILNYKSGAFPDLPDLTTRTIKFPYYADSCHAVSLTQPRDLFIDVSQWLPENQKNDSGGEE